MIGAHILSMMVYLYLLKSQLGLTLFILHQDPRSQTLSSHTTNKGCTPQKPERASFTSEAAKMLFGPISNKMSMSMPEMLNGVALINNNQTTDKNNDHSTLKHRNYSAEAIQVSIYR